MVLHGVILVVDDSDMITIFQRAVVVERGKAREVWPDRRLPDPPVEVHDVRMILFNQFRRPRQPIVGPRRRNISEIIIEGGSPTVHEPVMGGAVQHGILRVVHIGRNRTARSQEEIVFHAM